MRFRTPEATSSSHFYVSAGQKFCSLSLFAGFESCQDLVQLGAVPSTAWLLSQSGAPLGTRGKVLAQHHPACSVQPGEVCARGLRGAADSRGVPLGTGSRVSAQSSQELFAPHTANSQPLFSRQRWDNLAILISSICGAGESCSTLFSRLGG